MVREDIHKQQALMKDKTLKEKLGYFWYYYKTRTIVITVIVFFVICLLVSVVQAARDKSIFVVLVNTRLMENTETNLMDEYLKSRNINTSKNPAVFDVSIKMSKNSSDTLTENNKEKLWLYLQEDHVDVVVGDDWMLDIYAGMKPFKDLSKTLPSEIYNKYHDKLIYYNYKDYGKIPIAIDLSDCSKLKASGIYEAEDKLYFSIPVTSKHMDRAIDFLNYLYE